MTELLNSISQDSLIVICIAMSVVALFLGVLITLEILGSRKNEDEDDQEDSDDEKKTLNIKIDENIKYEDDSEEAIKIKAREELERLKQKLREEDNKKKVVVEKVGKPLVTSVSEEEKENIENNSIIIDKKLDDGNIEKQESTEEIEEKIEPVEENKKDELEETKELKVIKDEEIVKALEPTVVEEEKKEETIEEVEPQQQEETEEEKHEEIKEEVKEEKPVSTVDTKAKEKEKIIDEYLRRAIVKRIDEEKQKQEEIKEEIKKEVEKKELSFDDNNLEIIDSNEDSVETEPEDFYEKEVREVRENITHDLFDDEDEILEKARRYANRKVNNVSNAIIVDENARKTNSILVDDVVNITQDDENIEETKEENVEQEKLEEIDNEVNEKILEEIKNIDEKYENIDEFNYEDTKEEIAETEKPEEVEEIEEAEEKEIVNANNVRNKVIDNYTDEEEVENDTNTVISDEVVNATEKEDFVDTTKDIDSIESKSSLYELVDEEGAIEKEDTPKINSNYDYEKEEEENAIISYDELVKATKFGYTDEEMDNYADEKDAIISIDELEKLYKEVNNIARAESNVDFSHLDFKKVEELPKISEDKKFKKSEVISPVYGHIEENKDNLKLENEANLSKLSDEIKKTNDFLKTLKDLKKNLE